MTPAQIRALGVAAATLIASGIATSNVIGPFEGWVNRAYPDPAHGWAVPTACVGATQGVARRTYTDQECLEFLVRDVARHGAEIAPCLPEQLPDKTRAAFISAAFNIGTGNFCKSSMSRRALAGDLRGACDALLMWNKAGDKVLKGLTRRREAERQLCLAGLP